MRIVCLVLSMAEFDWAAQHVEARVEEANVTVDVVQRRVDSVDRRQTKRRIAPLSSRYRPCPTYRVFIKAMSCGRVGTSEASPV